ncbi:site-2 protease family protein [Papillibacter cinnamivorans]|uniref:Zn-dependent protease (Includes SpoIVFB) n=1 Tax=Papillibacter cinnamivorans DSM 12816 TaxID=1122930 RepID=A0A1W1YUJ9_9FIRM|nr:site-2 protease family protein [Papillibacter cinnamivorans]SMC39857.1 Zn-dependent protease (includes SpoIVFB) [Papillibacter cinnamivorans DSM 12816]
MNAISSFLNGFDLSALSELIARAAAVLICLSFHELSHGLVAYWLGDPTAKRQGRISINPLRHLDFFGTIMMLLVGFGWAKPVPVDMRYFKHPKRGMAATALAGPISNLFLAFVSLFFVAVLLPYTDQSGVRAVFEFLIMLASLNVGLGVFNLIPIPPLDGSKVLYAIFPDRAYYTILRYERFTMIFLMIGLYLGWFDTPLFALHGFVFDRLWDAASFIPGLFYR